jgi:hypothetical protein
MLVDLREAIDKRGGRVEAKGQAAEAHRPPPEEIEAGWFAGRAGGVPGNHSW